MDSADRTISPAQLARALGVGESTVKRWIDLGRIPAVRTQGGHRRIPLSAALHFVRSVRMHLEDPEALGLALAGDPTPAGLVALLESGRAEAVVSLFERLYATGVAASEIADAWVAPAMVRIGHDWEAGSVLVTTEHRATAIVTRALHALLRTHTADPHAPLAQIAALSGDPYVLPGLCAELVLDEAGYRVSNFGVDAPVESLVRSIASERPALVALTLSVHSAPALAQRERDALRDACREAGAVLVVGGRAVSDEVAEALSATAGCRSMAELSQIARRVAGTDDETVRQIRRDGAVPRIAAGWKRSGRIA